MTEKQKKILIVVGVILVALIVVFCIKGVLEELGSWIAQVTDT